MSFIVFSLKVVFICITIISCVGGYIIIMIMYWLFGTIFVISLYLNRCQCMDFYLSILKSKLRRLHKCILTFRIVVLYFIFSILLKIIKSDNNVIFKPIILYFVLYPCEGKEFLTIKFYVKILKTYFSQIVQNDFI